MAARVQDPGASFLLALSSSATRHSILPRSHLGNKLKASLLGLAGFCDLAWLPTSNPQAQAKEGTTSLDHELQTRSPQASFQFP